MLPGFQGVKWFHDFKGEKLAPKLEGAGFSTSCTKMCFKKPDASSKSFSYCESIFDFTPELQIYMFPSHHIMRKNKMWMWTNHCYVSIVMSPSQDALVITWKTYIFLVKLQYFTNPDFPEIRSILQRQHQPIAHLKRLQAPG